MTGKEPIRTDADDATRTGIECPRCLSGTNAIRIKDHPSFTERVRLCKNNTCLYAFITVEVSNDEGLPRSTGRRCPHCNTLTRADNTRNHFHSIRRERYCSACDLRYRTIEYTAK